MPKVTFQPSGKSVEVERKSSVYHAALAAGLPIASSCGGEFVCGKCNVQIVAGEVSQQTPQERTVLERERNPTTDRISCRTWILGDCTVTTRYW